MLSLPPTPDLDLDDFQPHMFDGEDIAPYPAEKLECIWYEDRDRMMLAERRILSRREYRNGWRGSESFGEVESSKVYLGYCQWGGVTHWRRRALGHSRCYPCHVRNNLSSLRRSIGNLYDLDPHAFEADKLELLAAVDVATNNFKDRNTEEQRAVNWSAPHEVARYSLRYVEGTQGTLRAW